MSAPTVNDAIRRLMQCGAVKQTSVGKRNRVFEAADVIELFTGFERTLASVADDTAIVKPSRPSRSKAHEALDASHAISLREGAFPQYNSAHGSSESKTEA